MEQSGLEARFHEAARRFEKDDAVGAKALLLEVDAALPGQAQVAYALALCHERLGEWDAAQRQCSVAMAANPTPQVVELMQRLNDHAEFLPGRTPPDSATNTTSKRKLGWQQYLPEPRQGVIIIGLLLIACAGFAFNQNVAIEAQQTEALRLNVVELPPPPPGALAIMVAQWITLGFVSVTAGVFVALYMLEDLPGMDFESSILGVATASAYLFPFLLVPVLGWIIALVLIARLYQQGIGAIARATVAFLAAGGVTLVILTLLVEGMERGLNSIFL